MVTDGWFAAGDRILDVGCGAGTNSLFLDRSGLQVTGVDLAPSAIAAARARAARTGRAVDFRVADALDLPFRRGSFDGAIDVGCFHTLPIPLRGRYVEELARVLRPGGRFALTWVAREHTAKFGPPHRPSVAEVAVAFEERFRFDRAEYRAGRWGRIPSYGARLIRRSSRQPPPR